MRRSLVAGLLWGVFAAAACSPFGPPSASTSASSTASARLRHEERLEPKAVAFFDDRHGLVAASDARGATWIVRTEDGGATWNRVFGAPGAVIELWVCGDDRAWALVPCGGGGTCTRSTLLRSTDGGTTWTGTPTDATWVTFAGSRAWAIVTDTSASQAVDRLATSIDDGTTWTTAALTPCERSPIGPLRVIGFATESQGLAVCATTLGAGGELHSALVTGDGGASWTVRSSTSAPGVPALGSFPYGGYVGGVAVAEGAAWLWGQRMAPEQSRDGGVTWSSLGIGDPDVRLVSFGWPVDASTGFVTLWDPDLQTDMLERTDDGGRTWSEVPVAVAAAP